MLAEVRMHGVGDADLTMSHFKLNEDLKAEWFDSTPPADYAVQTFGFDASKPTEATLIEALGKTADSNDELFPDDLGEHGLEEVFKKILPPDEKKKRKEENKPIPPKLMELGIAFGRGVAFAWELPESADAHYAGKGVKRGEPNRPIFWYKPEGKVPYRVIYADLTVKEAEKAPDVAEAVRLAKPKGADQAQPAKPGDQDPTDPKDEIPTESDSSTKQPGAAP